MLDFIARRRDADVKSTGVVRGFSNDVNDASSRASEQYDVFFRDGAPEPFSFLDSSTARLQPRTLGRCRAHDSDFDPHIFLHGPTNAELETTQCLA